MSITEDPSPSVHRLSCDEHKLFYSDICLHPGCCSRLMCRICKLNHSDTHMRNAFPLSDMSSDNTFIDDLINKKEKALNDKMNAKSDLLRRVNNVFYNLQNEIEKVLIETKTRIVQTIEDYYVDLGQYSSKKYFQEVKDYLRKVFSDLKNPDALQSYTVVENISDSYSKTMGSLDHLVEVASKFEQESLDFKEIVDMMKISCDTLSKSIYESSKEQIKAFCGKEKVKVAPQAITCMEHCSNAKLFVTGGNYGLITFWDEATFSNTSHLQVHDDSIVSMAYFPDLQTIVTSSKDKTLGILILSGDGSVSISPRMETQKVITQLERIEGQNKLATISEKGNKIRIWELSSQRLENVDSIEIPATLKTSRMFCLGHEGMLGVTYDKEIKIVSLSEKNKEYTLKASGTIVSCCYVAGTKSIHAIVSMEDRDMMRYQEVIWIKNQDTDYEVFSRTDIENMYGQPVDMVSNSHLLFTIFEKGFTIKKTKKREASKFVEVLAQPCETKNLSPAFLSRTEPRVIIPSEMKKMKIYGFC